VEIRSHLRFRSRAWSHEPARNKYTSTLVLKTTPLAIHRSAEVRWEDDGDENDDDIDGTTVLRRIRDDLVALESKQLVFAEEYFGGLIALDKAWFKEGHL